MLNFARGCGSSLLLQKKKKRCALGPPPDFRPDLEVLFQMHPCSSGWKWVPWTLFPCVISTDFLEGVLLNCPQNIMAFKETLVSFLERNEFSVSIVIPELPRKGCS